MTHCSLYMDGHTHARKTSAQKVTCDVSPVDNQFRTPLHWAAVLGLSEVVRMLMDKGANPLIADSVGATALHYTVSRERRGNALAMYLSCDEWSHHLRVCVIPGSFA